MVRHLDLVVDLHNVPCHLAACRRVCAPLADATHLEGKRVSEREPLRAVGHHEKLSVVTQPPPFPAVRLPFRFRQHTTVPETGERETPSNVALPGQLDSAAIKIGD